MTAEPEAKVFVVDDDDAVRDSLDALLTALGHDVELFPSGTAFLDACEPIELPPAEAELFVSTGAHDEAPHAHATTSAAPPDATDDAEAGAVRA